jgi:2',3'-cyclic-nucleotide 2'-phosphodiesterase (5'-nucleotidase family)
MARRATALKPLVAENPRMLLVDAGSTLFGESVANKTQGKVIVTAMNALGYDAMAIGKNDLVQGADVLMARASEAKFAMLSANLVVSGENGKTFLQSHVVVEKSGKRIAIIGLTSPQDMTNLPDSGKGLITTDPIKAVREVIKQVGQNVDAVVVVSHLGEQLDQKLAKEESGIAAIIGAGPYSPPKAALVANSTGTVTVYSGAQGEHMGVLKLHIGMDGRVNNHQWQALKLDKQYADDDEMNSLLTNFIN